MQLAAVIPATVSHSVPNMMDLSPQAAWSSNKNMLQHDCVVEFSMVIRYNVLTGDIASPFGGGNLTYIWIYPGVIAPNPFPSPK
jgi:hypothetical protein